MITSILIAQAAADATEVVKEAAQAAEPSSGTALIAALTIFALALFVGVEIITKIPATLHTPLMSGSNAISGITLVGAVLAAGIDQFSVAKVLGFLAVVLATINVVGGFLVTHRMLEKFHRRD
jgi:NAD(P) transhydrogenase subunit alpha